MLRGWDVLSCGMFREEAFRVGVLLDGMFNAGRFAMGPFVRKCFVCEQITELTLS